MRQRHVVFASVFAQLSHCIFCQHSHGWLDASLLDERGSFRERYVERVALRFMNKYNQARNKKAFYLLLTSLKKQTYAEEASLRGMITPKAALSHQENWYFHLDINHRHIRNGYFFFVISASRRQQTAENISNQSNCQFRSLLGPT